MKFSIHLILLVFCQTQRMSQAELNKVAGCVACRFIWENIEEALGT